MEPQKKEEELDIYPMRLLSREYQCFPVFLITKEQLFNIQIMRIYVKMRQLILTHKEILEKIEILEAIGTRHDQQITSIFNYIKELLEPSIKNRPIIGYKIPEKSLNIIG